MLNYMISLKDIRVYLNKMVISQVPWSLRQAHGILAFTLETLTLPLELFLLLYPFLNTGLKIFPGQFFSVSFTNQILYVTWHNLQKDWYQAFKLWISQPLTSSWMAKNWSFIKAHRINAYFLISITMDYIIHGYN